MVRLTENSDIWHPVARGSFDHLAGAGERQSRTEGRHPLVEPCRRIRVRDSWWTTSGGLDHQNYGERAVGLSWQQGPLSTGAIGRFLVPEPLPKRLLYVERLRRRMRVRFGRIWIADSENVLLFFEPG
jgi:hypothetical protein